jgi:transposase-like protein
MNTATPDQSIFRAANGFAGDFATDDGCLEFIKEQRWPNGILRCTRCRAERKHHRVTGRKAYACDRCGNHVYPLHGTVFAASPTSLRKWFYAIGLLESAESKVTARRIQRETGVTYKTAWRMLRRLRIAAAVCGPESECLLETIVTRSVPFNIRNSRDASASRGENSIDWRHE